jgi:hypothetical protein
VPHDAALNLRLRSGPFDEGAAQVANLLKRDEAELTRKVGIGAQAYDAFDQDAGEDNLANVEDFPDAFKPAAGTAPPQRRSCTACIIYTMLCQLPIARDASYSQCVYITVRMSS